MVYDRGEDYLPEQRPAASEQFTFPEPSNPSVFELLLGTPEVMLSESGKVCASCTLDNVTACVLLIHANSLNVLEQQLHVYSINTSDVFNCFHVEEDEYNIAVFGVLNSGLERMPAYTQYVRRPAEFSTSGKLDAIQLYYALHNNVNRKHRCHSVSSYSTHHCANW